MNIMKDGGRRKGKRKEGRRKRGEEEQGGKREKESQSNNCALQLNCLSEYRLGGKVYSMKVTLVPEILSFKGTGNISCTAAIFSQTN